MATQIQETSEVKTARKVDEQRVIGTNVLAFSSDPVVRWLYPNPHDYLQHFPKFVRIFGGKAI